MENEKNINEEEIEVPVFTLTDEETGEEEECELLAETTIDDVRYFALAPWDEEAEEYVILRVSSVEGDDIVLESIDDDDEFDKVEDYFNDLLFNEIDYDAK